MNTEAEKKAAAEKAAAEKARADGPGLTKEDIKALVDGQTAVLQAIKGMSEGFSGMAAGQKSTLEAMQASAEAQRQKPAANPSAEEIDLESMSQKDFAGYLMNQMSGVVKEAMKPVLERSDKTADELSTDRVKAAILKVAEANKDFYDFKPEIQRIATETPGIGPQDAYDLARLRNPEKAKELDEKYKANANTDGGAEGSASQGGEKKFGGLQPGGSETKSSSDMKPDDAASKAWDETMASLGDLVGTGETLTVTSQ